MKTRLIGDIHGDMYRYLSIIDDCEQSIQVGDFGIGFTENPVSMYDVSRHRFIRGNHDFPNGCLREPNFIRDGTVENDVMFIGGAFSIDWQWRTEGLSWWSDEECSIKQLEHFIEHYSDVKPRVMITHECPDMIADLMCRDMEWNKYDIPSRTRDAFDVMWKIHKPELWVYGHWHLSWHKFVEGTEFVCLNCNETMDVEL